MNDNEVSRLARLINLTTLLQAKRTVTATELASRFGVSTRTIYRDIRTLESAGIPVVTIEGKGFSMLEGYRIAPVNFTQQEALSLITAEKLVFNRTDAKTAELITAAMDKLRSALQYTDRDQLESITHHIQILDAQHGVSGSDTYQVLLNAITAHRVVRICYSSATTLLGMNRIIEPIGLYLSQHWHVVAFCRLRQDFRDFRLDRISDIEPTSEIFSARTETLQQYWDEQLRSRSKQKVVIIVELEYTPAYLLQQLIENKNQYGFHQQNELSQHELELTFMVGDLHYIARWLLTFAGSIKIVEPPELKLQVKILAEQALKSFGTDD